MVDPALRRLHEELASNRLIFSDVIEVAENDSEKRRWKLLNRLFVEYQKALGEAGLSDPHWGRREAVLHDRCQTDRTVVLIGASDLSDALVAMLRSLDTPVGYKMASGNVQRSCSASSNPMVFLPSIR